LNRCASGGSVAVVAISFTILGQPCSKANSRRIVAFGDRPAIVKSTDALAYERDAVRQIPAHARQRIEGPVRVTATLFYASERPDLDESIVLDVLQDRYAKRKRSDDERVLLQPGVYRNDRQVWEKHVTKRIDATNPRAEIEVEALQAQQLGLLAANDHASRIKRAARRERVIAEQAF
jgi:Holliday junction resolvase RusA-like endonuclease